MSANQQKRPRLSLQIKAISSGPNLRASRTIAAVVNPTSPTSFNTLSNVYATAIDRSTPVTAINTNSKQSLKLHTQNLAQPRNNGPTQNTPYGAPTPFGSTYPDTPLTAQPISPAIANLQDVRYPSSMTATPPLSAGPVDSSSEHRVFSFHPADTSSTFPPATNFTAFSQASPAPTAPTPTVATPLRRRPTTSLCVTRPALPPPYTRNRSLHSILRNSPLPPPTAKTPVFPRRQSVPGTRRVCYHSPIEQEIVNDQYVRSHIDLLLATPTSASSAGPSPLSATMDDSPVSPTSTFTSAPAVTASAAAADFMPRDGGMTPGPFEEMRRRMAGLVTTRGGGGTPTSPTAGGSPAGIRKRRRKERSRRWVWTIGTQEGEEEEEDEAEVGGAIAALRAAAAKAQPESREAGAGVGASSSGAGARPSLLPLVTVEPLHEVSPMEVVTPSIETFDAAEAEAEAEEGQREDDVLMYESEPDAYTSEELVPDQRRALSLTPCDMDFEMVTPTVAGSYAHGSNQMLQSFRFAGSIRQDSEGLFNPETGSRRDTPVPADLVVVE